MLHKCLIVRHIIFTVLTGAFIIKDIVQIQRIYNKDRKKKTEQRKEENRKRQIDEVMQSNLLHSVRNEEIEVKERHQVLNEIYLKIEPCYREI